MAQDRLLNVEIVTPQKVLFKGKAESVTVPGSQSPFQILYNHAPIVSSLDIGIVRIIDENSNSRIFATTEGFAEVRQNSIAILVDNADVANDLHDDDIIKEIESIRENLEHIKDKFEITQLKKQLHITENKQKALNKLKEM